MTPPSDPNRGARLAAGVERFQAGDLAGAERSFRQVLDAEPDDADALHLLGLCRHQVGQSAEAVTP